MTKNRIPNNHEGSELDSMEDELEYLASDPIGMDEDFSEFDVDEWDD